MNTRKLKRWVKVALVIITILTINILFIGQTTIGTTPYGDYTCKGGIIKVCTGSEQVKNYLG